jgi:hypothetical protein
VIGIDQEPAREILDELDRILGPGRYSIAYAEDAVGIRGYVRTREQPYREWAAYFAPALPAESVLAVWRELALRIDRIVNGAPPVEPPPEEKPPPGEEGPPLGGTDPEIDNTLPPGIDNELPPPEPVIDNELPVERPDDALPGTLPTRPEIDNTLPTLDEPPLRRTAEECDDDDALEADDVSER